MINKAFLDVFQHLSFRRCDSFLCVYMRCAVVEEYMTQVTENIGLSEPPGTHYPTCHIELPCTSQCLKFTDIATNFPCNFLQQGLGKLGAGRKRQTASKDGVGLCFSSRRCRGPAWYNKPHRILTHLPAVIQSGKCIQGLSHT